ncbi:MAG: hypothetical protein R3C05_13690 [Pirellulaceae bacterium]
MAESRQGSLEVHHADRRMRAIEQLQQSFIRTWDPVATQFDLRLQRHFDPANSLSAS